jgi:hypothetical protein
MRGTIGVFISMAGYTADAIAALRTGGERSVLLLDENHMEAVVSGLVPPDELLDLALDHASFRGEAYIPLLELLASTVSAPAVTFDVPPSGANEPLSVGISARVACIGVVAAGHLAVVGGGFPDRSSLFTKRDGSVWVLDPINEALNQVTPTVVRLGERLGEEERHQISPSPPWPVCAAWLDDTRLVLAHNSSCSLIELGVGIPEQVRIGTSDCVGLVALGPETLMTVSGHANFEMPVVEVVAASFAASDSGDLAGYRAEVTRLAGRHVPPSGRNDAERQTLYNDTQRLMYDQLGNPSTTEPTPWAWNSPKNRRAGRSTEDGPRLRRQRELPSLAAARS